MGVLINLDKVRDLTNFNPYLVSLLSSVGLERYPQLADHYISKHLCSIFDDMEKFNNLTKFCQMQLENVYEWSRICLNNLPCLTSQLSSFTTLWAAKEHFFFYRKTKKGYFQVYYALPCLRLFLKELVHRLDGKTLPANPIVNGFIFES